MVLQIAGGIILAVVVLYAVPVVIRMLGFTILSLPNVASSISSDLDSLPNPWKKDKK